MDQTVALALAALILQAAEAACRSEVGSLRVKARDSEAILLVAFSEVCAGPSAGERGGRGKAGCRCRARKGRCGSRRDSECCRC